MIARTTKADPIHCPACHHIVFKTLEMGEGMMEMRCPNPQCGRGLVVQVSYAPVVSIELAKRGTIEG